ncbi:MAG: hypothetical protein RL550_1597 [Actinomycetota bacterium]
MIGPKGPLEMDRLVFVGTELLDGTTGEHQTHHVENTGHSGQCALVEPLRLMGWSESAATHLDRPVDTGVTRCEEMALPIESSIDEVGWADGAVVARGEV